MRFSSKFFVLCLFLCLCNGTPRKQVGTSSNPRSRTKFTDEEDKFIIEELLRLPNKPIPIFGKLLWEHILEKHCKKVKQNIPGFPCERRHDSLRKRFSEVLLHNHADVNVKVPESLFQKFPELNEDKPQRDGRYVFTQEENEFIFDELLNSSDSTPYTSSTWEALRAKHDAKRIQKLPGFGKERTSESLRTHMVTMKRRRLLPKEIAAKLRTGMEDVLAASSSRSTPPRETIELQETNVYDEDDEWVDSLIQEPSAVVRSPIPGSYTRFTEEEDKFLIEEMLSLPGDGPLTLGKVLWGNILEKHHEKWRQSTPGFPCERSVDSLRKRLTNTLLYNYSHIKVKAPEALLRRFPQHDKNNPHRDTRNAYTPQENQFIVEELLEPSCTAPYAKSTWEVIRNKHDLKRRREWPGFEHKRTTGSLRTHMTILRRAGLLPVEVEKKLRAYIPGSRGKKPTPPGEAVEAQENSEDQDHDAWAAALIEDLNDFDSPDFS